MIIFIAPIGRTGSWFLQSLLSDHHQISLTPGAGLFNALLGLEKLCRESDNDTKETLKKVSFEKFFEFFIKHQFNKAHTTNGGLSSHFLDSKQIFYPEAEKVFRSAELPAKIKDKKIDEIGIQDTLMHVIAMHNQLLEINNVNSQKNILLLADDVDSLGKISLINETFNLESKTIVLGRELFDNCESMITWVINNAKNPFKIYSFFESMIKLNKYDLKKNKSHIVTLEKLKKDKKNQINMLANFCEIKPTDKLYESTFCTSEYGRPITVRNPNIKGFEMPKRGQGGYKLTKNDEFVLERLFVNYKIFFGEDYFSQIDHQNLLKGLYENFIDDGVHFNFSKELLKNPILEHQININQETCIKHELNLIHLALK